MATWPDSSTWKTYAPGEVTGYETVAFVWSWRFGSPDPTLKDANRAAGQLPRVSGATQGVFRLKVRYLAGLARGCRRPPLTHRQQGQQGPMLTSNSLQTHSLTSPRTPLPPLPLLGGPNSLEGIDRAGVIDGAYFGGVNRGSIEGPSRVSKILSSRSRAAITNSPRLPIAGTLIYIPSQERATGAAK